MFCVRPRAKGRPKLEDVSPQRFNVGDLKKGKWMVGMRCGQNIFGSMMDVPIASNETGIIKSIYDTE
jgi:hypothetical protein